MITLKIIKRNKSLKMEKDVGMKICTQIYESDQREEEFANWHSLRQNYFNVLWQLGKQVQTGPIDAPFLEESIKE